MPELYIELRKIIMWKKNIQKFSFRGVHDILQKKIIKGLLKFIEFLVKVFPFTSVYVKIWGLWHGGWATQLKDICQKNGHIFHIWHYPPDSLLLRYGACYIFQLNITEMGITLSL